jgi:[ribosomal protein S18]-alanine N-acetyltransferase
MTGFEQRPLGALDLDVASSLHRAVFTPLGERGWTRQDMAELCASPGVGGVVLSSDGKEIGFALCRVAVDEAELLTIAVDAVYRRQGAGRLLLDTVIDHARAAGALALFLEVGADNPAACSLYEQRGFAVVGQRVGYYQRGTGQKVDALVMRLALTPGG